MGIAVDSEAWKVFAEFFHTLPNRLDSAIAICQSIAAEKKLRDHGQEMFADVLHGEHYRVWCALRYHYSYWKTDEALRALLSSVELMHARCDYEQPLFTKFASFLVQTTTASGVSRTPPPLESTPPGHEPIDFIDGCSVGHAAFHRAPFLASTLNSVFGETRKRKSDVLDDTNRSHKKQRAQVNLEVNSDEDVVVIDPPSPRVPTPPHVVSDLIQLIKSSRNT